ncbi:D-isomer specific 2-hydroxyacid dehydrogenase [Chytriomyces sp. MP71]|nr:D-isomer specific 2-hydroxyacid dehydrogenase [Chytriomyces sp. MP71]
MQRSVPRVLLTRRLTPLAQQRLENDSRIQLVQWTQDCAIPPATFKSMISGCDGAVVLLTDKVNAEVLEAAGPQLKVVSTVSVGYDHINVADLKRVRPDLKIGITPDVLTDATAELTIGLLLATARRFKECLDVAKSGQWGDWNPSFLTGTQISGKSIGMLGFGRIGQSVASRLKGFNPSSISYFSPSAKPEAETAIGAHRVTDLNGFLGASDIVIVTCKLTDETLGLFNKDTFASMKPGSLFLNTARGGIVHHMDLYDALANGVIGSAGLDVTDPEPFPADHPLLTLPNCLILPHVGSATMETREAMADLAVSNVLAGVFGQELPASIKL